MAMKNIDFKQLMLQKGEKIGMGVALVLMLVLVVSGAVSGFTSDNPVQIAEDIKTKATKIENTLASGPAVSPRAINEQLLTPLQKDLVVLAPFRSGVDNFIETALEDNKHKNPEILVPVEWQVEVVRAPVKVLIVSPQGEKLRIGILKAKAKPKEDTNRPNTQNYLSQRFGGMRHGRNMRRYQMMLQYMEMYQRMQRLQNADSADYDLELVESSKVDKESRLATTVQPQRMVIVSAAFPYKHQLDAYRFALKEHSLEKLAASKDSMPQFLPFNVQRRTLNANGKEVEKWADLDLVGNYSAAFQYQFASEEEDPSLKDVIFKGLVMARPQLARGEYGRPRLNKIDESLGHLMKERGKDSTAVLVTPMERKLARGSFDPFGQVQAIEDDKVKPVQPQLKTNPEQGKGESQKLLAPNYCLVRFIDADEKLKPGMTYEYRMQIKVVNPNFGKPRETLAYPSLADDKELTSAWWPKEGTKEVIQAKMQPEFYYYGVELDDRAETAKKKSDPKLYTDAKDVTFVQAHRWLEKVRLNPDSASTQLPVGDWSVSDIPVRRCEYIIRTEPVDLPIWFPVREAFGLATPPAAPKPASPLIRQPLAPKGIAVNFAPPGEPDLLVDFEGGKVRQSFRPTEKGRSIDVREDAAVEYLILKADGSLIVRNSRTDAKDPVREKSYSQWKKLIDDTRGGKKGGAGGKNDPF